MEKARKTPRLWVATVDARRASLYSWRRAPGGRLNLDEQRAIDNDEIGAHERRRPSMLSRGPTANAVHHADWGHQNEEEVRRFARRVLGWLEDARKADAVERICVFAPARMLGMLRQELNEAATDGVELREGEFRKMPASEMAEHPALLDALGPV